MELFQNHAAMHLNKMLSVVGTCQTPHAKHLKEVEELVCFPGRSTRVCSLYSLFSRLYLIFFQGWNIVIDIQDMDLDVCSRSQPLVVSIQILPFHHKGVQIFGLSV